MGNDRFDRKSIREKYDSNKKEVRYLDSEPNRRSVTGLNDDWELDTWDEVYRENPYGGSWENEY